MTKPIRLSYVEKRKIDDYLRGILTKTEEGLFDYPEGQTDLTVAKHFGCNANHVASVRREAFGRRRASRKTSIEDRIRAIEAHLDDKTPGWRQQKFLLEGE